jgi:hypothetical protein
MELRVIPINEVYASGDEMRSCGESLRNLLIEQRINSSQQLDEQSKLINAYRHHFEMEGRASMERELRYQSRMARLKAATLFVCAGCLVVGFILGWLATR